MAPVLARKRKVRKVETPAVTNDGVLPTEVLSEVLLCLPAKELCRLRLVCPAWKALTSDPSFAKAHSTCHPLIVGLRKLGCGEIHIMDLSSHSVRRIHLEEAIQSYELSTQPSRIFISGGITGAYALDLVAGVVTVLPKLVINHITCSPEYVLGYVPSTREYKVLRSTMCLTEGGAHKVCHVITLGRGNGQWRARAEPPMRISRISAQLVVVNGVACFLSSKDSNNSCAAGVDILMFDLATEEWQQLALQGPSSSAFSDAEKKVPKTDYSIYLQLVEWNGCLVIVYPKWDDNSIDLWFLVDMSKGLWTKRYIVCYSTTWDECRLRPLTVLADGR